MPTENLSEASSSPDETALHFRPVSLADAPHIWKLVRDTGVLDVNSPYCYLLLCRDFADTCLVACRDSRIVGFVTAYRPPERTESVFVWQIGVAAEARGAGVARSLLHALLAAPGCRGARYLEATVTPSNAASRRLFQSFAERIGADCSILPGFEAELFPGSGHEKEDLFRIGPLT